MRGWDKVTLSGSPLGGSAFLARMTAPIDLVRFKCAHHPPFRRNSGYQAASRRWRALILSTPICPKYL